jgi:hypothetical protein
MSQDSLVMNMPPGWKPGPRVVSGLSHVFASWINQLGADLDRAIALFDERPEVWTALLIAAAYLGEHAPDLDDRDPRFKAALAKLAERVEVTPDMVADLRRELRQAAGYDVREKN